LNGSICDCVRYDYDDDGDGCSACGFSWISVSPSMSLRCLIHHQVRPSILLRLLLLRLQRVCCWCFELAALRWLALALDLQSRSLLPSSSLLLLAKKMDRCIDRWMLRCYAARALF